MSSSSFQVVDGKKEKKRDSTNFLTDSTVPTVMNDNRVNENAYAVRVSAARRIRFGDFFKNNSDISSLCFPFLSTFLRRFISPLFRVPRHVFDAVRSLETSRGKPLSDLIVPH